MKKQIFVMILGIGLLAGCATAPAGTQKQASLPGGALAVIDTHTHAHFTGKPEKVTGIMDTEEEYFRQLREAGVVASIVHASSDGKDYRDLRAKNVITCAGISSRPNVEQLEAGLKSGKFGCMKVYLGYIHQFANSEAYQPVYRLAQKYDVPVVFHTGDTYSTQGKLKYADPLTIDEVAVDFPKVRFVIAHLGNPWIQSAAEVAYKNPNVYVEASALLIGNMDELPAEDVEEYMVKPIRWAFGYMEDPGKLMFGTDWPLNDVGAYLRAYKKAIPKEHWQAVFHDNAVKVFKLKARGDATVLGAR